MLLSIYFTAFTGLLLFETGQFLGDNKIFQPSFVRGLGRKFNLWGPVQVRAEDYMALQGCHKRCSAGLSISIKPFIHSPELSFHGQVFALNEADNKFD